MNYLLIAVLAAGLSGATQVHSQTAGASKVIADSNGGALAARPTCSRSNRPNDVTSMEPDYEMSLAELAPAKSCTEANYVKTATLNPAELLAKEPSAAGQAKPALTRVQVSAEFVRARDAGELIWWKD